MVCGNAGSSITTKANTSVARFLFFITIIRILVARFSCLRSGIRSRHANAKAYEPYQRSQRGYDECRIYIVPPEGDDGRYHKHEGEDGAGCLQTYSLLDG